MGLECPMEDRAVVLEAVKAMIAGAVQDRVASAGAMIAAVFLLLTAWVLGIAALILLVAERLGMVGALASVTAGLVVLALAILGLTRMRNRGAAEQRATTRALWTATAVNAASSLLRRGPEVQGEATPKAETSGSHRSVLLIGGGLMLILLGFLFPSGKEDETAPGTADTGPGPEDAA